MQTLCTELSPKMHITPQMTQALAILSLSGAELDQLITKEFEENPLLERTEHNTADGHDSIVAQLENKWLADYTSHNFTDKLMYSLEQPCSLTEHLEQQLSLVTSSDLEWRCGRYIIASLDDSGYLCLSIDDIVLATGISSSVIQKTIRLIKNLEPIGFGCCNLTEYLLLQLETFPENELVLLARQIISNNLFELAERNYSAIVRHTRSSNDLVLQAVKLIQNLNPRPVNAWRQPCSNLYIVPDLIVEYIDNKFTIFFNPIFCCSLRINSDYKHLNLDAASRNYISRHHQRAYWLIRCIQQRETTLRRVTETIMLQQRDFLKKGFSYLKPLNLKHIANETNLHESTVSRAINRKYIQTPQGTYALKQFFPSGFLTSGQDISSSQVQKKIADILTACSAPNRKVSDQLLVELLQKEGIRIARRTVTKYRNQMGFAAAQPHYAIKKSQLEQRIP